MKLKIFIEPLDILLFRESKPFSGGESHFARSVFPPPPSTIYAAIRSYLLSLQFGRFEAFKKDKDIPKTLAEEIGFPENLGTLELSRMLLAQKKELVRHNANNIEIELLYPIPFDVVRTKGSKPFQHLLLKPVENFPVYTNLLKGLRHLWLKEDLHFEAGTGWLNQKGMQRYLDAEPYQNDSFFAPEELLSGELLFKREERTGIARDRQSRSVRQGLLYSIEYIRLKKGVGFFAEIKGTNLLPKAGLINLGGDRRPATYAPADSSDLLADKIRAKIEETKRFKLFLISPALFENGWRPKWVNPQTLEGILGNVRFRLLAASIGKSIGIGGFDLVKQHPKPIHRFVPAGSVYFFEILEGDVNSVMEELHWKSISEDLPSFPETSKQGFGYSLVGGW